MESFRIENLGPIVEADIKFGNLTFLVGPQASGKSLALESLKFIADRDSIINTADNHNYIIGHNPQRILNVYYGEGLSKLWKEDTQLILDDRKLSLKNIAKKSQDKESSIFYMPAQRIICMEDGFPKSFGNFPFSVPYVVREFSEIIRTFVQFGMKGKNKVFPLQERLKNIQKRAFDKNIFHQGEIVLSESAGQRKMMLKVDDLSIPFMAWSTGQKEFMPLLLGLYCLSGPPSKVIKREKYKTVIIEEPEMGLHPKAIESILIQICELICSGYKVIVSTHSSLFIDFAWAYNTLLATEQYKIHEALCELFKVSKGSSVGKMLKEFVGNTVKTYFFNHSDHTGKVEVKDISSLDVMSDEVDLAEWGGIMDFPTRANEVISKFS